MTDTEISAWVLDEMKSLREENEKLRKVVDAAKNHFTDNDLEGLSPKYFKSYYAVKNALKEWKGEK